MEAHMTPIKTALAALAIAAGAFAATPALAWGGHHHGGSHLSLGFSFGVPYYAPYYAPYYYPAPVYYSAPVVVQSAPQVYTERQDVAAPAPAAQNSWYYCAATRGYYPYVQECPSGWQRVPAAPAR